MSGGSGSSKNVGRSLGVYFSLVNVKAPEPLMNLSGKLHINLHHFGHFDKRQSDESELKWPPDSHLAQ